VKANAARATDDAENWHDGCGARSLFSQRLGNSLSSLLSGQRASGENRGLSPITAIKPTIAPQCSGPNCRFSENNRYITIRATPTTGGKKMNPNITLTTGDSIALFSMTKARNGPPSITPRIPEKNAINENTKTLAIGLFHLHLSVTLKRPGQRARRRLPRVRSSNALAGTPGVAKCTRNRGELDVGWIALLGPVFLMFFQ
jgi:hypothetical protein